MDELRLKRPNGFKRSEKVKLKFAYMALVGATLVPGVASAATVTVGPGGFDDGWATAVTYENDNSVARRGVNHGRDDATNALGMTAPGGGFFEIGFGSTADFTFGTSFTGPVTIAEISFGDPAGYPETVEVFVGSGVGASFVGTSVGTFTNAQAQAGVTVDLSIAGVGPFETLRMLDTSPLTSFNESDANGPLGGFDLDAVRVAPAVPLPASGVLLAGALAGAAALRRKARKA
jgi:hypothetical protein